MQRDVNGLGWPKQTNTKCTNIIAKPWKENKEITQAILFLKEGRHWGHSTYVHQGRETV